LMCGVEANPSLPASRQAPLVRARVVMLV